MSLPSQVERCQTGTLIDERYRLLRPLGEGGMGSVWLARHERLGTLVAIKVLRPLLRASVRVGAAEALIVEAQIAAQVRHPAVVSILDSGYTPFGDAFLAMEYLEGRALADLFQREGSVPALSAVRLLLPLVDALRHCHGLGFVHRDIKPGNIFLARERGRTCAKLLDFGVARPASVRGSALEFSGTPGYMAPEQVNGDADANPRSDVWALCAVLYEAVAARSAIPGNSCAALLRATLYEEIAPLQEGGGGESSLWRVLERGLRKDPRERYQSMGELHGALTRWLEERSAIQADRAGEVPALDEPVATAAHHPEQTSGKATLRDRQSWVRPRRMLQWVAMDESHNAPVAASSARSATRRVRAVQLAAAATLMLLAALTLQFAT